MHALRPAFETAAKLGGIRRCISPCRHGSSPHQRLSREIAVKMVVRSIDVGFGNTKYVVAHSEKGIKCTCFPSLAYTSATDPSSRPSTERRRTVSTPIGGLYYEVGPDVHLAADTFR